jgi:hypothetical protein
VNNRPWHAFSVGPLFRNGFASRILGENTLTICTIIAIMALACAHALHIRLVLVMAMFQNVDLQLHGLDLVVVVSHNAQKSLFWAITC